MARRLRSPCSAAAFMLSYSGERWLISMTDIPLPCQSSSSSRARSRTGRGRAAGPALKLKMRLLAGREAVVELTVKDPLETSAGGRATIRPGSVANQNSRNPGTPGIGQITQGFLRRAAEYGSV